MPEQTKADQILRMEDEPGGLSGGGCSSKNAMQLLPDEGWEHQWKQRATESAAQYAYSRPATSTAAAALRSGSTNVTQA